MYPLSRNFKDSIKKSQVVSSRAEVYEGIRGALIYNSSDIGVGGFTDGEVGFSSDAIRRRAVTRFVDHKGTITPSEAKDIFTTYGHEIKLYRGLRLPDGTFEEIPLIRGGISDVAVDDPGGGVTISIDAYDRGDTVTRNSLVDDLPFDSGTNFGEAIQQMLLTSTPNLEFNFVNTPYTTPPITVGAQSDVWAMAIKFATAIGCELFFDPDGICVMRSVPDYSKVDPVWDYSEGSEATILYVNKRLTNRETFNYFIVTGEHSSNAAPVRGVAFDDNSNSATYYKGSYGTVPAPILTSKLITTPEQATQVARALLQQSIGQAERLHFNAIVNPAHESGDVVTVTRAKSKISSRYVIDRGSIPMTHDRAMDLTTRVRQAVS